MIKRILIYFGYASVLEVESILECLAHEFALCRFREVKYSNYDVEKIRVFYNDIFELMSYFNSQNKCGSGINWSSPEIKQHKEETC